MAEQGERLSRLVGIMRRLLGPDGCPWDRVQTHRTLRSYVIEEAYEVVDAIDRGGPSELRDELGDLLLQVVFHSELARLEGAFTIDDVVDAIADKLERRHPHVFGGGEASTPTEVEAEWERIKKAEGREHVLEGISRSMPALRRAHRFGQRLARVGFDWPDAAGARRKVTEELEELDEAVATGEGGRVEAELGDVLLVVANLARHLGVHPEDALGGALDRFQARFQHVEERLRSRDARPEQCSPEELDALWEDAKAHEQSGG